MHKSKPNRQIAQRTRSAASKNRPLWWRLSDWFLPCQLCDSAPRQHGVLCDDCARGLPWLAQTIERHEQQIWVACHYESPISNLIQQFKYQQQLHWQRLLGQLLTTVPIKGVQAIVPMPISPARLQQRGYNQALLLAKQLQQQTGLPIWQPVQRHAQHSQKGLSRVERLHNLDQQFAFLPPNQLRYRHVLLLDDVVTTGSSIAALAEVLYSSGCHHIQACCVAAAQV